MRAADRWKTLRKFAPALIAALEFRAARASDPMLAALKLLVDLAPIRQARDTGGCADAVPQGVAAAHNARRPAESPRYETAVLATLRNKLRSGDVWVERSSGYRRFDSYLVPPSAVPPAAAALGLPATADEWLATQGAHSTAG